MDFSATLKHWYHNHHRDLPWRQTRNPYFIWLSEVILQQTRVDQGMRYYHAFTENFPTVTDLARAPEEKVLKLWQGLGYYSRARNLHAAAKYIVGEHKAVFPDKYADIIKLKGVGDYTAAAIASICFGEAKPVIDGNVYRVLARVFGIREAIDSTAGKKQFRELAESLMDHSEPGIYNQAVMEFGALHCTPRNPSCPSCPLLGHCEARKKNLVDQLPCKAQKTKQRNRYFYYLVLNHGQSVYFRKRSGKDIWTGLYDFPLIETEQAVSMDELSKLPEWKSILNDLPFSIQSVSGEYKHILSHQKLFIRFIEIKTGKALPEKIAGKLEKAGPAKMNKLAVPVVIQRFLETRVKN